MSYADDHKIFYLRTKAHHTILEEFPGGEELQSMVFRLFILKYNVRPYIKAKILTN